MYEKLLTPNEFSNISGLSKQTLLFYEKKKIFFPIFKDEKGYRFYSLDQIDIIVTIQALQAVGLSLKEIQNYIAQRNADLIYQLYKSKITPFKNTIAKYTNMLNMLEIKMQLIQKANTVLLNTIYLEYKSSIPIVKSSSIPENASDTMQYKILCEHIEFRKEKDYTLGHAIAGIVNLKKESVNSNEKTQYTNYYTILPPDHDETSFDEIPNGTYIIIYHKGPYNQTFKSYPVILDYAKRHHYELDSMVYEESLIDETVESNPNNYITQIAIRIIGSSVPKWPMKKFQGQIGLI